MDDTTEASRRRYHELLARLTPAQRLAIVCSLTRGVRELAIAGIRASHPEASEREALAHLAARLYGRDVAVRLYGEAPGVPSPRT